MHFVRRDMLTGSAASVALAALVGCRNRRPPLGPGARVVIVGAGFAGIGAARMLSSAGLRPLILEARTRVGGRAWTDGRFGAPVDLGASWLHRGDRNALAASARRSGIRFHLSDYDSATVFGLDTDPVRRVPVTDIHADLDLESRLRKTAFWPYLDWRIRSFVGARGGDRSVGELVDAALGAGADPLGAAVARITMGVEYAIPLEEEGAASLFLGEAGRPNHEYFMTGGMQTFAAWLAQGLDIRLGETVRGIAWEPGRANIRTDRGAYEADAVILTSSVGLLKAESIMLEPGLPAGHLRALERLDMGLLNKVALRFPRIAWPMSKEYFVLAGGELPCIVANHAVYSDAPILLALTGGASSRRVEQLADREVAGLILRDLGRAFGRPLPEPEEVLVTRWGSDPLALGSYSHRRLGANLREDDLLAEPIGDTLYLAGEAIIHDGDLCNVSGAYRSGRLAAARAMTG